MPVLPQSLPSYLRPHSGTDTEFLGDFRSYKDASMQAPILDIHCSLLIDVLLTHLDVSTGWWHNFQNKNLTLLSTCIAVLAFKHIMSIFQQWSNLSFGVCIPQLTPF